MTSSSSSTAAASRAMLIGPRCSAECGDDSAGVTWSICRVPSGARTTPKTSRSGGSDGRIVELGDRVVDRLEAGRHVAQAHATARRDRDHPAVVVGVDDARSAEPHLAADADHLAQHLDAAHVAGRVEDRVRHRDGRRHALVVAPPRLGRGDAQRRGHDPAGRVAHVVSQGHRLALDTDVEHRCALAEIGVALQCHPRPGEVGPVLLGRQRPDITVRFVPH